MNDLPEYFCVYQCRDCGRAAFGDVKSSEPPGWDYDDDECEWLCPEHALHCPTCDLTNTDEDSVNYCSNLWHLTGEDRIP